MVQTFHAGCRWPHTYGGSLFLARSVHCWFTLAVPCTPTPPRTTLHHLAPPPAWASCSSHWQWRLISSQKTRTSPVIPPSTNSWIIPPSYVIQHKQASLNLLARLNNITPRPKSLRFHKVTKELLNRQPAYPLNPTGCAQVRCFTALLAVQVI